MRSLYYLVKKKKKSGYIWYCIYDYLPSRPKSTGIYVENDPKGREATAWAERNYGGTFERAVTLNDFAKDFFLSEKCSWASRMLKKGHTYAPDYFSSHRGRLVNYILPAFGKQSIRSITTKQLDQWLMGLKNSRGRPFAPGSLEKMITALKKIFEEAEYQGIIEKNPAKGIAPFKDTTEERQVFTLDEIRMLFPREDRELLYVWQSRQWAAYFMCLAFCGLRPGEAKAITPSVWYRDLGVVVIKRSIENITRTIKDSIKTSKRGVKKKTAILPDRLNEQLLLLESELDLGRDDLFFTLNGRPIGTETALKHFRLSAKRADVELGGRTPYCFRHTYNTLLYQLVTLEELQRSMGHVTRAMTNLYLHPEDEMLAEKTRKQPMTVKEAVNCLFDNKKMS